MSWQRVQLIGKLLRSSATYPPHSHGDICDRAISSHEVVSHINYSRRNVANFLLVFQLPSALVCVCVCIYNRICMYICVCDSLSVVE
jgi:predicted nucleic acid-binding Zn ribbon protein